MVRRAYEQSMRKLSSSRPGIAALLPVVLVVAGGCGSSSAGGSSSAATAARGGSNGKVVKETIADYAFAPATLTVTAGTTVSWTNRDNTPHTATASNSSFDTGAIDPGQTRQVTFTKPGTYTFICSFHPFMHGTIIVK